MKKVNFFTTLSSFLDDKESINLTVQKTGLDLTVLLVPKINGKTTTVAMSGTAEELDEEFFTELSKPVEKIKGLVSNAEEAVIEDVEEEEEESEDNDDKKDAPAGKKAAPKKAASKKLAAKKAEEVKPVKEEKEVTPGPENPEGKTTEQIEAEIEAERLKEEAAAKAEAERLSKEKAVAAKEAFDDELKAGDEAFKGREFLKAQKHFQAAVDLFPEDEKAKAELSKATKWVNQLREAGLLKEEEEGGNDGANS